MKIAKFKVGDKARTIEKDLEAEGEIVSVGKICGCGQTVYKITSSRRFTRKAVELAKLELNIDTLSFVNWEAWAEKAVEYMETLTEEQIDFRYARLLDEDYRLPLVPHILALAESKRRYDAATAEKESLISSALDKGLLNNISNYNNFEVDKEIK